MHYWKFGVHFGGMNFPNHYNFIHAEQIALGAWHCTPFCVGDLVAITDGFTLLAIVKVKEHPKRITDIPAYAGQVGQYNIAYIPDTIVAKAEWRILRVPGWLPIMNGCCQVHNPGLTAMLQNLWDNGN